MATKKKYSPRKIGLLIDSAHFVLGTAIIVMAVMAIFNPDSYKVLFPVIFMLAGIIDYVNAWFQITAYQRNRSKRIGGFVYLIIGILLTGLAVISAISIWGNP
ncbi:MAG: hypothetical protein Q4B67_02100 [Eubacteriales bacterium]|nr:hypothetical protein [Eubacteriales bacterium]